MKIMKTLMGIMGQVVVLRLIRMLNLFPSVGTKVVSIILLWKSIGHLHREWFPR